jgi:hypothetical protein
MYVKMLTLGNTKKCDHKIRHHGQCCCGKADTFLVKIRSFYSSSSHMRFIAETCSNVNPYLKFALEQATKTLRGSRGIAVLGTRWGVGGQRHAPAALPPGKTRYPLYRRLGGPQGRSGRVRKIAPPPPPPLGIDPRTVQPVASKTLFVIFKFIYVLLLVYMYVLYKHNRRGNYILCP